MKPQFERAGKYTLIATTPDKKLLIKTTFIVGEKLDLDFNKNKPTTEIYLMGNKIKINKSAQIYLCCLMLCPKSLLYEDDIPYEQLQKKQQRDRAKDNLVDTITLDYLNMIIDQPEIRGRSDIFKLDVVEIEEKDDIPIYDKSEFVERYADIVVPKIAYSYWDIKTNSWSPPRIMNYYDAKSAGGGYDGVRSVWVLYNEKEKSILRVMNDTDKKSFAAFMPEHFLDTDTDNDDANMFSEHINDFHFECIDQLKIIIEEKLNAISEENNNNSEQAQERFVALLETDWKPLLAFQYWNDTLQQWSIPYAIPASAAKQAGKGNFSGFKPIWVWYDEKNNTIKRPLTDDERKIWLLPDDYRDSNLTGKAAEIYKQELYYRECLQLQIEMMKELKEKELNNSGYNDLVTESRIYPPKTNDETGTDQDNN